MDTPSDEPISITLPPTSTVLKDSGMEPKSLAVGDEVQLTATVTASDQSGVTLEVKSAMKPEEPGTPQNDDEATGDVGEPDTSKATDFVKKQREMGS